MQLYRVKIFDTSNGYQTLFMLVNEYLDITRFLDQCRDLPRFFVEEVKRIAGDSGALRVVDLREGN